MSITGILAAHSQDVQRRQLDPGQSFCSNGGICTVKNSLYGQCDQYYNLDSNSRWHECLCANGYLAADEACYWCDLGFNLDIDYRGASDKAACASVGVVVAPLPQSVLDQQSSRNVTWFGSTTSKSLTVPTSGTTAPGNMSTTAPITAAITRSAPTSTTTIRIPDQNTWYGGVTSARTLDGGASAFTTTPTATSLTPDLSAVAAQITTANGDNRLTPISIVVLMLVLFVGVLLM